MYFIYFIVFFFLYVFVYQQRENILFRYEGSKYEEWDDKMKKPWWILNSRPDWREKIHPLFSFLWDGYHLMNWLCSLFVWAMVACAMWPYTENLLGLVGFGLWMGITAFVLHQVYFSILYRRK